MMMKEKKSISCSFVYPYFPLYIINITSSLFDDTIKVVYHEPLPIFIVMYAILYKQIYIDKYAYK